LPLPIERVIPQQPKHNDPFLRLPERLRRNSLAKKKHLKISAAPQRRRCIVRESVAGDR
jgi:hypothetical protein